MKIIAYWTTTGILAAALLGGGAAQLMQRPENAEGMLRLGYPLYVMFILGAWKLAGAIVLLAPRLPRVKEWAYAGIFFLMTGAAASHVLSGDGAHFVAPMLFALFAVASWALRPESRRMSAHV